MLTVKVIGIHGATANLGPKKKENGLALWENGAPHAKGNSIYQVSLPTKSRSSLKPNGVSPAVRDLELPIRNCMLSHILSYRKFGKVLFILTRFIRYLQYKTPGQNRTVAANTIFRPSSFSMAPIHSWKTLKHLG